MDLVLIVGLIQIHQYKHIIMKPEKVAVVVSIVAGTLTATYMALRIYDRSREPKSLKSNF